LAGMIAHRASEARNWRQIGRILFGLGLLLLSLRMIGQASAPLRDGTGVPAMLAIVRGDAVILFLMAGMTAWLFHSSLAAILLAALFAAQGLIAADQAVPIVLGINFGGAIMALTLTRTAVGDGRIVPLANLLLRGTGAILALMASSLWGVPAVLGGYDAGNAVVALHIGFNAAVLVVGLCVAGPLCAALHGVLAQRKASFGRVTALNTGDLGQPDVALRNASREALVLSGMIETMLATLPDLLRHGDADAFTALEVMDADCRGRPALCGRGGAADACGGAAGTGGRRGGATRGSAGAKEKGAGIGVFRRRLGRDSGTACRTDGQCAAGLQCDCIRGYHDCGAAGGTEGRGARDGTPKHGTASATSARRADGKPRVKCDASGYVI
jgi:hypothetical protein